MALSQLSEAGQFRIEHATIITSDGTPIDLLPSGILAIEITESVNSMAVAGWIACSDTVNLVSTGPVIGQEYLRLRILTPQVDDDINSTIDFMEEPLVIINHVVRDVSGNGVQSWVLEFSSRQFVMNNRTKVHRTLTGTWSDIATEMLTGDLGITKPLSIEPTVGVKKFIAPNIRPHKVLEHAMHQGVSQDGGDVSYYCYETVANMNFRSLSNMYSSPEVMSFQPTTPGTQGGDPFAALGTMYSYTVSTGMNLVMGHRDGRFASNLIVHDLTSKSHQTYTYNYLDNFDNEPTIEGTYSKAMHNPIKDYPPFSDISVDSEGSKRISDYPHRTFLQPTSTSGGQDNIYPDNVNQMPYTPHAAQNWLQERLARGKRLPNTMTVNMECPGNTFLHVGEIIHINVPTNSALDESGEVFDPYYTGKYLIYNLKHGFNVANNLHKLNLTCVKDSAKIPYSSGSFYEDALFESDSSGSLEI
tara:strand:- start:189 stop:1607 length:1419 start_codon:yes stop_codon:yes gene_type:complete